MTLTKRSLAGRQLDPIGLGCMSLSQAYFPLPDETTGEALLNRAIDIGYQHFDTAPLWPGSQRSIVIARFKDAPK